MDDITRFVPFKGDKLYWQYSAPTIEEVRAILQEKFHIIQRDNTDKPIDGIYELYCYNEVTHSTLIKPQQCDHCNNVETDTLSVFWSRDPYHEEINPEIYNPKSWWCDTCYHEACMDI